jgi:light-regulated signal transduction histidine kinase (bacteriophytochrome)
MNYHRKTKEEIITELQELKKQYLSLEILYKQGLTDQHRVSAGLLNANEELSSQHKERENRLAELVIANKELSFQNKEKEKRAAELVIANKELSFQNKEKEKRAAELGLANKELYFQEKEKAKRAAELILAKKEIIFQTEEKDIRAAANKELEAFSYSVSHDLRAPLRHINGYVDLLLNRFLGTLPDKAKHYLESIAESSRQMSRLIDDLLEFSRTGRQEMRQANLDMNGILEEIIISLKKENCQRNIQWEVASLPLIYGDESMLTQVWVNLLANAVKFTRTCHQAVIKIQVVVEKREFVFSVCDNGVGFDMQYAQKLFGVFQRLHLQEEFEGTGIGLATVSAIIAKHGGRTWAEAALDRGATFFFSLPKHNSLIRKH